MIRTRARLALTETSMPERVCLSTRSAKRSACRQHNHRNPPLLPAFRVLAKRTFMPDDHSPPEPPLPIPNRTVKRRYADDSVDCPCESRSLSGTLQCKTP